MRKCKDKGVHGRIRNKCHHGGRQLILAEVGDKVLGPKYGL
jgi:hypothetical protein